MRSLPTTMADLIAQGGPFIGDAGAPHGRVTVEKNWYLNVEYGVSTLVASKLPFRWWQRLDNSQVETEVPNIKSITIDRTLDADAAQAEIVLYNQWMDGNTVAGKPGELGSPGYFTWSYGGRDAAARWGQSTSPWNDVLIPNALLRTYQGYGGRSKTISQSVFDGNIMLTGVWLIDEVRAGTDGTVTLRCRDMAKLLLEQQLFPPLMPNTTDWYPLSYRRWIFTDHTSPAVPVYDKEAPDPLPTREMGQGAEGPKFIPDGTLDAAAQGYWMVGTDGGVFSFNVPFYGSQGTPVDNAPFASIAADPLGHGYWICGTDGAIFAFGDVQYYGGANAMLIPLPAPITRMAAAPDGRGYWLLGSDGNVWNFGSAVDYGNSVGGAGDPFIDIVVTPSGNGYWLLTDGGAVFTHGDALYYGGAEAYVSGAGGGWGSDNRAGGMAARSDGLGYWIVTENGTVVPFGICVTFNSSLGFWDPNLLTDPITAIASTPSDLGYTLFAGDGRVFPFGDAPFYGGMNVDFTYTTKSDGNYKDYVDIIKDLLLWAGWLAYGAGDDEVYGNLESTGAYTDGEFTPDLFDKKPVIDALNAIKEIVGYHLWIDEEGAVHFESPNWPDFHGFGNFLENGTRVETLPVVDEEFQLTDYTVTYHETSVRSELIISSRDPTAGLQDTVTTKKEISSPLLRGMVRPAMWVNEYLSKASEQERMIERLLLHITYSLRQGNVQCLANPAIQINDQIRIYERQTGETFVHYVRGVHSAMDLDAGTYMTTITTNWLGEN